MIRFGEMGRMETGWRENARVKSMGVGVDVLCWGSTALA